MPLKLILLKGVALAIFAIFIIAFIFYYNKPADGNHPLALNFVTDTSGKRKIDSLDSVKVYFPSSKSIILRKDKPLPLHSIPGKKDTSRHTRLDTSVFLKRDTLKTFLQPK